MAQPYPRHPYPEGAFAPIHMECEAADLVIEGEVPKDLFGTFYRNGPNPGNWRPGAGQLMLWRQCRKTNSRGCSVP